MQPITDFTTFLALSTKLTSASPTTATPRVGGASINGGHVDYNHLPGEENASSSDTCQAVNYFGEKSDSKLKVKPNLCIHVAC